MLLARNAVGYQNLIKLSSIGYTEGFYRRPRIDNEVLASHSEGIVCLAACLSGEVALYLRQGRYDEAREGGRLVCAETFGRTASSSRSRSTASAEELEVAKGMLALGKELGLAGRGHQRRALPHARGRRGARRAARASAPGTDRDDPKRFRFTGSESYVKSAAEMRALFPDQPDVLENTQDVADLCEFDFEKQYFVPSFPLPEGVTDRERPARAAGDDRRRGALRRAAARRRCRSGSTTSSASSPRPATPATS